MNNKDKIIKKLRNSSMSYLARYEVSTYQFENTLKRKMSYYENDLKEEEKKNILNLIKEEMLRRSKLLESVAKRIIDRIFEDNKSIKKAKVEISKINPPIEGDVESVSIILKRKEL